MGNRAVITFDENPTKNSIGVYLHWNGGEESIVPFVQALDTYRVRTGESDPSYQLARFIQIVGNYFGGSLSLGVGVLSDLDLDNGDNGVYKVVRTEKGTKIYRSPRGKLVSTAFTLIDVEAALKHEYSQSHGNDDSIQEQLAEKNDVHFRNEKGGLRS